jgi:hypothetical protein
MSAIEELQGTSPSQQNDQDIDQLLQQQQQYEKTHGVNENATPASPSSAAAPVPATSSSVNPPPSSSDN